MVFGFEGVFDVGIVGVFFNLVGSSFRVYLDRFDIVWV